MTKKQSIAIGCSAAVVFVGLCTAAVFVLYGVFKGNFVGNDDDFDDDGITTDRDEGSGSDLGGTIVVNNEDGVLEVYRPEIDLLIETLNLLDGGKNLPDQYAESNVISYADFDEQALRKMMSKRAAYDTALRIPDYASSLFTSEDAYDETKTIVYAARNEFIEMIKDEGVDGDLVEELEDRVFPADEDHLAVSRTENMYGEFSFVRPEYEEENWNYKEAYMRFEVGSVYTWAYLISRSGAFGEDPGNSNDGIAYWKNMRELGIRYVMYHEMTHVLQMAYENCVFEKYGTTEYEKLTEINRSTARFLDDALLLDTKKLPFTDNDNYRMSQEAQAVLVQHYFLVSRYKLTEEQSLLVWNYAGDGKRLNNVRKQLAEVLSLIRTEGPSGLETMKFDGIAHSLTLLFEKEADPDMKDFLLDYAEYSDLGNQVLWIGYAAYPEYSKHEAKEFLAHLASI